MTMPVIFPPMIVSGARPLAASITFEFQAPSSAASEHTFSSITFGDAVKGRNQKWAVCALEFTKALSAPGISLTDIDVAGVAGSVIYDVTVTNPGGLRVQTIFFTARIDDIESGDIVVTLSTSYFVSKFTVLSVVNLDCSAAYDTAAASGDSTQATLRIDCPAGGGVIGIGEYAESFDNLDELYTPFSVVSGSIFASAQTNLDVDLIAWSGGTTQCDGFVVSFPFAL